MALPNTAVSTDNRTASVERQSMPPVAFALSAATEKNSFPLVLPAGGDDRPAVTGEAAGGTAAPDEPQLAVAGAVTVGDDGAENGDRPAAPIRGGLLGFPTSEVDAFGSGPAETNAAIVAAANLGDPQSAASAATPADIAAGTSSDAGTGAAADAAAALAAASAPSPSAAVASTTFPNAGAYPYSCVCYITAEIAGSDFQGSGVIIGPHTVLTASHMLWDQDSGQQASSVTVYPGYSKGGSAITGNWVDHFFQVDDGGGSMTAQTSETDYAVIDFASNLSAHGSYGVETGYGGGTVHLTGYPASANGQQTDQVGTVSLDPSYSVLNYGTVSASPGNSGGPVWVDLGTAGNPQPYVVGVVSTTAWATQLTASDWNVIQGWEQSDSSLWNQAPVVTAHNVSVGLNQSIAASSMFSASDPDGDSITQYAFEDAGGDGGHFTINGAAQPDGQWISVSAANLGSVNYVGGPGPGSETLYVSAFDGTAWASNPGALVATTGVVSFTAQDLGPSSADWTIQGAGDFAGDANADILWRDASGEVGLWASAANSTSFTWQDLGPTSLAWSIEGVGDFNGDGKADILWRGTSGDTGLWNSTPGGSFTWQDLGTAGSDWTIEGVGDFSGDGKADILWRSTTGDTGLWDSTAGGAFTWQDLGIATSNWTIQGVGDFNGDGKADILWRSTTGDTGLWASSPGSTSFTFEDLGPATSDWSIKGTGDFNGDGRADILWGNTSGDAGLWLSNGASGGFAFQDLGTLSSAWQPQSTADFAGDRSADILWRNSSGDVSLWNSSVS